MRSSGSGWPSRLASTTTSAPRTHSSQPSVTRTSRSRSAREPLRKRLATVGAPRVHPDLLEPGSTDKEAARSSRRCPARRCVPACGAWRRQILGADGCHRAGADLGDRGRVEDRHRHPGLRVQQQQQRQLRWQPAQWLSRKSPTTLTPACVGDPARHVDVAVGAAREQVGTRLDHRLPAALIRQHAADAVEDLVVGQRGRLDGRAIQVGDLQDAQSRNSYAGIVRNSSSSGDSAVALEDLAGLGRTPGLPGLVADRLVDLRRSPRRAPPGPARR